MILPFKPQFKEPILAGTKIHTIRDDKHERWAEGKQIHFATGVRTKNYNQFKLGVCTGVQDVFMTYHQGRLQISIDNKELYWYEDRLVFAHNDGFATLEEFEAWFIPLIRAAPKECYSGKLIHWTELRY